LHSEPTLKNKLPIFRFFNEKNENRCSFFQWKLKIKRSKLKFQFVTKIRWKKLKNWKLHDLNYINEDNSASDFFQRKKNYYQCRHHHDLFFFGQQFCLDGGICPLSFLFHNLFFFRSAIFFLGASWKKIPLKFGKPIRPCLCLMNGSS
jgi:hypothetical protein